MDTASPTHFVLISEEKIPRAKPSMKSGRYTSPIHLISNVLLAPLMSFATVIGIKVLSPAPSIP